MRLHKPSLATLIASTALLAAPTPPTSASSGTHKPLTASTQSRTLVAFKEEQGGIVFRYSSLIVSTRREATVRFEGCVQRFHLRTSLWKSLKAALKRTNVHALAGNHVLTTPGAEESTWVIIVGHDTVRITAPGGIPQDLRVKLEPLLKVLGEAVSVGKRDMPQSCGSKRTVNGTGQ